MTDLLADLDLSEPDDITTLPSLYELLRQHFLSNVPLNELELPSLQLGDQLSVVPGFFDHVCGGVEGTPDDWCIVKKIIYAINIGRVQNWRVVERNLKGVGAFRSVDTLLENLRSTELSDAVKQLFWETACKSRDYEVVKWGIVIGSHSLDDGQVAELLLFANYPEFTPYTVVTLQRAARERPDLNNSLVALLPLSRQWGVVSLIERLIEDKNLISDFCVQREILIYGMENNDGISMEVAFTIASHIDLPHFFWVALLDARVYAALAALMTALMEEPDPVGGLADLPEGEQLLLSYIEMLQERCADTRMLYTLYSAELFLDDEELEWPGKTAQLEKVRHLFWEKYSKDVLQTGLQDKATRWSALALIRGRQLTALLPDVEALCQDSPDVQSLSIMSELGGQKQWQMLLDIVPRLVDLAQRAHQPFSAVYIFGPEHKHHFEYAQIVEALGKLATPEAIAHLKRATQDYDPVVRAAACKGLARLGREHLEPEILELIEQRMLDPAQYVAKAAREAGRTHGLPLASES